jgi:hypothetical protein
MPEPLAYRYASFAGAVVRMILATNLRDYEVDVRDVEEDVVQELVRRVSSRDGWRALRSGSVVRIQRDKASLKPTF